MTSIQCEACRNNVEPTSVIRCCKCFDYSCLLCANISLNELKKKINSWICHLCRTKERKGGDNTNTPVRLASINSTQNSNVTLRKPIKTSECTCISSDKIREIFRSELNTSIKKLFSQELDEFKESFKNFEQSLNFISQEFDSMRSELNLHKTQINELQKENETLRKINNENSARIQYFEQLNRSTNVEIQCVPEHKNENLVNMVQQIAKVVKCPLPDNEIHYCTRTAKLMNNSDRPRSILVKLSSQRMRDNFLGAVVKFNKSNPDNKLSASHLGIATQKKTPIFVTEHLTPQNKLLHAAARLKAKELSYRFVWTRNGRIFVRKTEESRYVYVRDMDTLSKLS